MIQDNLNADLLIVGGGVLGTFHAYHALSRGLKVILLEKSSAPRGATVRNFGQVVPSGMDQVWQRFGIESLQIYKELQHQTELTVRELGSIYIASNEEEKTLIEELNAINLSAGYPSELWTAEQCRKRYPQLKADYCKAGLFFPQEISVNPREMISRLQAFLAESPRFQARFDTCVCDLVVTEGASKKHVKATTTCGQTFFAEKAIVCSGSDFSSLFPTHFRTSDLVAVKLQMLRIAAQRDSLIPGNVLTGLSIRRYESFSQCPSWETIKSREPQDSFEKQWGVHILFKQEADGSIILGDSHEYSHASKFDQLGFDLREEVTHFMIAEAKKIFDLPSWDVQTQWAGIYCQTDHPSGIHTQTIDEQIHIVTGIGGKGMTSSAGFSKHHLGVIYDD